MTARWRPRARYPSPKFSGACHICTFAYIDKILAAWAAKGITTVEAAEVERTAAQRAAAGEYSFDIGEAMRIMEQNTDE